MTIDEMCEFIYDMGIYRPNIGDEVNEIVAFLRAQKTDNPPLTIEQLETMDGQPVWIVEDEADGWALCKFVDSDSVVIMTDLDGPWYLNPDKIGKTWQAYAREQEVD